jgi:hypothetical protein
MFNLRPPAPNESMGSMAARSQQMEWRPIPFIGRAVTLAEARQRRAGDG